MSGSKPINPLTNTTYI